MIQENLHGLHLLYHALTQQPSLYSYDVTTRHFEKHVRLSCKLTSAVNTVRRPIFTFDDGHISNYEYALPILSQFGLTSIFFVTVNWIGTPTFMTWQNVRAIGSLKYEIGSHTLSHRFLTHCNDSELEEEILGSKELLENQISGPVQSISFPGGRYNRRVVEACQKAGYLRVYTSDPYSRCDGGISLIGRNTIQNHMDSRHVRDLITNNKSHRVKMRASFIAKRCAKSLLGDRLYEKVWRMKTHHSG